MRIHSKTRVSAKTLVFIVELFPTNELTAIITTSQLLHKYITTIFLKCQYFSKNCDIIDVKRRSFYEGIYYKC